MASKKKEKPHVVLKISKDGRVMLDIADPKHLTDDEQEKRDKKYAEELEHLKRQITGKHLTKSMAQEICERKQQELIEITRGDLIVKDHAVDRAIGMVKSNNQTV